MVMSRSGTGFGRFLFLWSGQLISAIGSGLTAFGLGIYTLQQTGQASAMALVTLLAFMPSLLLSPVAGVLADRYDRRLLMVLGGYALCLRSDLYSGLPAEWRRAAVADLLRGDRQLGVLLLA
ncbi:MFS transporter [Paenibacillus rhizoplanae]